MAGGMEMMVKPDNHLTQLKKAYPKRSRGKAYGWPDAYRQLQKRLAEGHSFETILQGTKDYCAATKLSGDYGTEFVKQACTFYGPQLCFLDEYELEDAAPEVVYRRPEIRTKEQQSEDARQGDAQLADLQKRALRAVK